MYFYCVLSNQRLSSLLVNVVWLRLLSNVSLMWTSSVTAVTVECERCQVNMAEVPHKPGVFYSDHAVVTAEFLITRHEESVAEGNSN